MTAGKLAEIRHLPVQQDDDQPPAVSDLLSTLALLSQARRQLADVQTVPDARHIIEGAGLAEDAARRVARLAEARRLASDLVEAANRAANDAAILRIEAQVKAGLLISALQEDGSLAHRGRPGKKSDGPTFSDAGIERREAHVWRRLAAIPSATLQDYLERSRTSGREVTTKGLLRHAAEMTRRSSGLDPALMGAQARRDIRKVHRGLMELPTYRPEALVSALSGGERQKLLATLSDAEAWVEDVRRELAIHGVVDAKEG
jgi:hypothetical protein